MELLKESRELACKYFKDFSDKNIIELKKQFSKDIYLRDWEIEASGIIDVINTIQKIFDTNESLEIKIENLICEKNIVSAEIEILINKETTIKVVDIIRFNEKGEIMSIKAFKG